MAKATRPAPVSKTVKKAVSRQTTVRRYVGPALAAGLRCCVFAVIFGSGALGVHHLWARAVDDPRFRMDCDILALAGAVHECPESVADLEAIGKRFSGRSLLDPLLITDMEYAYGQSVWIKKVTRLRRRFPNRIDLEVLHRLPAAQVWHNGRYWMIDMDGTLLPVPGSPHAFASLPEIVGVTSQVIGNRPGPGEIWGDEGVLGALGVMRSFWESTLAETLPIARVIVNTGVFTGADNRQREIRRRFEVVTTSDVVVRWGTYNPGNQVGELTSSEKLWQLQDLLLHDEALRPGVCFDVRTRLPGFTLLD